MTLDGRLFLPEHPTEPYVLSTAVIPADRVENVKLPTSDGQTLDAYFVRQHPAGDSTRTTTVLYCRGNAYALTEYWKRVELLWSMGYNVLIFDYRGFGFSTGSPNEDGLYLDTRAADEYLRTRADVDPSRIAIYGCSLGGAVGLHRAAEAPPKALVLESVFASIAILTNDELSLDVPSSWFLNSVFDNVATMRRVDPSVPIFMMHGMADDIVAPRYAQMVHDARPANTALWMIPRAGHVTVPDSAGTAYSDSVRGFIDRAMLAQ